MSLFDLLLGGPVFGPTIKNKRLSGLIASSVHPVLRHASRPSTAPDILCVLYVFTRERIRSLCFLRSSAPFSVESNMSNQLGERKGSPFIAYSLCL